MIWKFPSLSLDFKYSASLYTNQNHYLIFSVVKIMTHSCIQTMVGVSYDNTQVMWKIFFILCTGAKSIHLLRRKYLHLYAVFCMLKQNLFCSHESWNFCNSLCMFKRSHEHAIFTWAHKPICMSSSTFKGWHVIYLFFFLSPLCCHSFSIILNKKNCKLNIHKLIPWLILCECSCNSLNVMPFLNGWTFS